MNPSGRPVLARPLALSLVMVCALSCTSPEADGPPQPAHAATIAVEFPATAAVAIVVPRAEDRGWDPGQLPPDHPAVEPQFVVGDDPPIEGTRSPGVAVARMPEPDYPTRPLKRMNVDQLDDALQQATGGIAWAPAPPGSLKGQNQFVALARTLGKPDYADMTSEDLVPSALFQKFLQDAAVFVCDELIKKDPARPVALKTFFVAAGPTATPDGNLAAVDANLRQLLLRFHGRAVPANAPELQKWRFLLASAQKATKSPQLGWQAVCVGLVTHPNFYLY
ncbi:MAG: hypothetical protein EXR79_00800 [Myxococcales bacterium]|nr:hypothetical protein [Myxococcales bacterium]